MLQKLFGYGGSQSQNGLDEDLSPEDAQLMKTLMQLQQEGQSNTNLPLIMSQDGLKAISKIYYTDKFKDIQWTSNINQELPIKCTATPIWSKEFEDEAAKASMDSSGKGKVGGKDIYQLIREKTPMPYGSEKPITLCDAFIRKYLSSKKTKVCMQIRRSQEDARLILENLYKGEEVDPSEIEATEPLPVAAEDQVPLSQRQKQSPISNMNQPRSAKESRVQSVLVQYTWSNFFLQSLAFSKALVASGVPQRSIVTIQGLNSPEHFMAVMGTICANCIFSDQHMTSSPQACLQQMKHSGSKIIVCESWQTLKEKYLVNEAALVQLGVQVAIIYGEYGAIFRGDGRQKHQNLQSKENCGKIKVYNWTQFLNLGQDVDNRVIIKLMMKQKPGSCCNLLYTSGTTADNKGAMLSHDNMSWFWEIKNRLELEQMNNPQEKKEGPTISLLQNFQDDVHIVSFLPMSHILAQVFDLTRLICNDRQILITFAPPAALQENLIDTFREAQPTELIAVPRVYEKLEQFIRMHWQHQKPLLRRFMPWAQDRGFKNTEAQVNNERSPFGYNLLRVLVLDKIKKALGLNRIDKMFNAATALKKDTSKFFASLNMPITSIFGLTETAGAVTYQEFPNITFNQNGRALPGTKIKIFNPDEEGVGEICIKGRNVFMGYLKRDDENMQVFDQEGFLHTGDIGYLDKEQRLQITGRLKDIIITAGDYHVLPEPIEMALKAICPIISYCVLVGDRQKYLSMLITLKAGYDGYGKATEELDPSVQSFLFRKYAKPIKTIKEAMKSHEVQEFIAKKIAEVNAQAQSREHTIKKWIILDQEFTVDHGELTPTLKIKRKVIANMYDEIIESMYEQELAKL